MNAGRQIAVVDVETTGLSPWRHDRIIEIAVVVLNNDGTIQDEYETLVNPGRDVGPTRIHGITATDVIDAPTFDQIAGDIVALLRNTTILAGHNVSFDHNFLTSEFERLSSPLPSMPLFCTCRRLGRQNLAACCRELGITVDGSGEFHSALFDARATAQIVARLMSEEPEFHQAWPPTLEWPSLPPRRVAPVTRSAARRKLSPPSSFLSRISTRNVHETDESSPNAITYLGLLDRVLEDRIIDTDEECVLLDAAERLGLSKAQVLGVHMTYIQHLAALAAADGVVTDDEISDLRSVSALLGINGSIVADVIQRTKDQLATCTRPQGVDKWKGKRVCFTGELQATLNGAQVTRPVAERLAEQAGLIVSGSVTKKLDFLVAADANTQSGKARKARAYGIEIVDETTFWQTLGIAVQ